MAATDWIALIAISTTVVACLIWAIIYYPGGER